MPDDIVTYDGSTHKISFTTAELDLLFAVLDNVSVKGVGAAATITSIAEKILEKHTPKIPEPAPSED